MKIGLTGTMSVGKTTLVNALKENKTFYHYNFATERSEYLMNLGIPLNTDSTLKGQTVFLAERCAELMQDNIITDRTILDVLAFTQAAKSVDQVEYDLFEQYAIQFLRDYDHIFYISPEGMPIEDNGVRETDEHFRDVIDFSIITLLKRWGHRIDNITEISGTTEQRIKQIEEAIS
ncbi:ATP-binding protein [bacterium]|nr:ATP-binding protein [bacterium]